MAKSLIFFSWYITLGNSSNINLFICYLNIFPKLIIFISFGEELQFCNVPKNGATGLVRVEKRQ